MFFFFEIISKLVVYRPTITFMNVIFKVISSIFVNNNQNKVKSPTKVVKTVERNSYISLKLGIKPVPYSKPTIALPIE